jgi:hypothetical protein
MNKHGEDENIASTDINRLQMKFLAQLFKVIPTFNHIDDLFQWLALTLSQQFNVRLTQFWSNQINHSGQRTARLRTMVRQDTSIPEPLAASEDIAQFAQRVAYEQRIYHPQAIDQQFSQYRATLLRRYGLNFFAACFVYANLLIPPENSMASDDMAAPLAITVLLFLPQQPRFDFMPAVLTIMKQAINVSGTRGLLLPLARQLTTTKLSSEPRLPSLGSLIPRRKQDTKLMLSSNPLSSSTVITNKPARRLYSAIDGHSDMTTLCARTGMHISEACAALQILLTLQRAEVYTPSGMLVDTNVLLKDS